MSVLREYDDKDAKYQAKLARRMKLPTLDMSIPSSFLDEPEMVATRVAATKTILRAAKSVLALPSSIDGRMLPRCSGFLIEYDEKSKSGIVVTTADLICSRKSIDDWCIPRPHLGLKFSAIKFRSVPQIDKISREYKIEDGLIVQEVSEGSLAEELGVRVGDIVTSFNGLCISDTVELEHVLLRMSEDHFYKGKRLNSKMNVKIGVFHMRNRAKREITLSVNVSESGEVVLRD
ncbi:hypothetical protein ACQ4PT_004014 [Festuca glaucescens]